MTTRKKYDREFKENAVKLSMSRNDIPALARELGIDKDLLYTWRSEYRKKGSESFPGKGYTSVTPQGKEDEKMRKELIRLQKENDILKKALGIISRNDL